jgi:predicted glycosyltransferase
MRLLIEAHHPAHIHFFKHAIAHWVARGDQVKLVGRDRDVMKKLLSAYDYIPSEIGSVQSKNNHFPFAEMLTRQACIAQQVFGFGPDLVLSLMGSYTQAASVLRVPSFIFTDSEFQHFNHRIAHPFATRIYTPDCFWKDLGDKQRRYAGYHELAFLHPSRFTPDSSVLSSLGIEARGYVVVRVSAWDTLHDVGQSGFGAALDEFLGALTARYKTLIVPERGLIPERWQHLVMQLPPEKFHDVLAFANFVVTEGASTAAEAACLGVPSVYLNSTSRGYLDDIQTRYELVHCFTDARAALKKVDEWLTTAPDPSASEDARRRLIADHIDVTQFVIAEVDHFLSQR